MKKTPLLLLSLLLAVLALAAAAADLRSTAPEVEVAQSTTAILEDRAA